MSVRFFVRSPGLRRTSPRRWSAVANTGSIGRRGPTNKKFGKRKGTFSGSWMAEARINFSAVPPSRTRCVATAHSDRVMVRSQSCPLLSMPFTVMPTNRVTLFEIEQFRVLLLRRLRLPLPLSVRGHHRAACSRSGVLGSWWRVLLLKSAGMAVHECPPT